MQAEWARLLMASFADAGVRDLVASPGSRSTPWLLAALAESRFTCHSVADERSAAFFALGLAKASGRPSLLLCTSGSAAAHYFPAIVEAAASFAPLLVLTADRPVELQAGGANQTIDQVKLYGDAVRQFFDLGGAEARPGRLARRPPAGGPGLRPQPGRPSPARCTSMPAPASRSSRRLPRDSGIRAGGEGHGRRAFGAALPALRAAAAVAGRAGARAPAAGDRRRRAAAAPGRPGRARAEHLPGRGPGALPPARRAFLADSTSQLRFGEERPPGMIDNYGLLLGNPALQLPPPDLLIQLGNPLTTTAWPRYLEELLAAGPGPDYWVLAPWGWRDGDNAAGEVVNADLEATLELLLERLPPCRRARGPAKLGFVAGGGRACGRRRASNSWRRSSPSPKAGSPARWPRPCPKAPSWRSATACRSASSTPGAAASAASCWCSRSAAPAASTAWSPGAAGAARLLGRPSLLILGDVSLGHDLSGLELLARLSTPLVVLVINNQGGRIFEQLAAGRPSGRRRRRVSISGPRPTSTIFRPPPATSACPTGRSPGSTSSSGRSRRRFTRPAKASCSRRRLPEGGAAAQSAELRAPAGPAACARRRPLREGPGAAARLPRRRRFLARGARRPAGCAGAAGLGARPAGPRRPRPRRRASRRRWSELAGAIGRAFSRAGGGRRLFARRPAGARPPGPALPIFSPRPS